MIISIGKIKGIYQHARHEFLRAHGSDDAAYREAIRFLDINLRMYSVVTTDEWWFALMLRHIKNGSKWSELWPSERSAIVKAVRQWGPEKAEVEYNIASDIK